MSDAWGEALAAGRARLAETHSEHERTRIAMQAGVLPVAVAEADVAGHRLRWVVEHDTFRVEVDDQPAAELVRSRRHSRPDREGADGFVLEAGGSSVLLHPDLAGEPPSLSLDGTRGRWTAALTGSRVAGRRFGLHRGEGTAADPVVSTRRGRLERPGSVDAVRQHELSWVDGTLVGEVALLEVLLLSQQDQSVDGLGADLSRTVRDVGNLRKLLSPVPPKYPGRDDAG